MWRLSDNPKTLKVTRSLANQFATMEPCPGDRPLSERRLQVYEQIARAGEFRPVSWAAAVCKQTGSTYRINGKHTSTLFSGMDPLPELYAVIEYYNCDTLEEVAQLYSSYDSKMQSRTVADINRSFARTVPQLEDVSERTINLTVSAVAYNKHLDNYNKIEQPATRAEGLLENYDFAVWVQELLGRTNSSYNYLKRVAVFAAMLGSYRKSKSAAETFWSEVRDETGPTPQDATRRLARFLVLSASRAIPNRKQPVTRYRVSDREMYVKAIHAWNAWRRNETTNLNYYANAEVPDFK